MVDFISKRLQVFVSSTFRDLIFERQAAVEAILTAGHIPAGMELFTSGDESQMEVIKQWIDESDVYLLVLGGRYGSVEPSSNKSYTQLEYEYALQQSKPIFSCAINEAALEEKVKEFGSGVIETDNPAQLKEFRKLVLSKTVRFWDDRKDIKITIGETLSHFARREDLIGWIRPHQEANMPALVDEIARLSKENAALRAELNASQPEPTISGLNFKEMYALIEKENILDFFIENGQKLATGNSDLHYEDEDSLEKLCLYGLVVTADTYNYLLTEDGRRFLNKFAIEKIVNSKNDIDEA